MKYTGIASLVFVFGAAALSACTGGSGSLEGALWRMTTYRNANGEMVETLPKVKTTAEFKDGQVGGKAACNNYNGPYNLDGDQISFGMMISTMMMCEPDVMDQEMGYMATLETASTFDVKNEALSMFNADGEVVLAFTIIEPASLVGTNWLLTSYNNGKGGMQSAVIGTEITAEFGEDGTLSGSAGCNRYNAPYEATEDTISIGIAASTEMACMDPEGIMEQELQYLESLQNAAVFTIRDDRLEIRDENGSGVAYYNATP